MGPEIAACPVVRFPFIPSNPLVVPSALPRNSLTTLSNSTLLSLLIGFRLCMILCITAVHKPRRSLHSCTGFDPKSVLILVSCGKSDFRVMHIEAPAASTGLGHLRKRVGYTYSILCEVVRLVATATNLKRSSLREKRNSCPACCGNTGCHLDPAIQGLPNCSNKFPTKQFQYGRFSNNFQQKWFRSRSS